jgi:putative ABC transport system permease protein
MLAITIQDLRYRARQFLIAVGGASLVFAMSLLLTGLANGFHAEIDGTVQGMGAQWWVLASGATGRILGLPPLQSSAVSRVRAESGVTEADPVIVAPQTASAAGKTSTIILIGYRPGSLGNPSLSTGRQVVSSGEATVDAALGLTVGQRFSVAGQSFVVVGTVVGRTLAGGSPDVYVTLGDAQRAVYGGRPLISAVLTRGTPADVPMGLALYSNTRIEQQSLDQQSSGVSSINNTRFFMWFIAAVIVAALVYVTALERTRDFAVLKALGASSRLLFAGLAFQAVVVSLLAAAVAAIIANFMTGLFAQPVDIPPSAFVVLPISALVVGILASLAALRRAISADPAMAFAGA